MTLRNIAGAGVMLLAGTGTAAALSPGCADLNERTFSSIEPVQPGLLLTERPLDAGEKITIYISEFGNVEAAGWSVTELGSGGSYLIGPFDQDSPSEGTLVVPAGGLLSLWLVETAEASTSVGGLTVTCSLGSAALPEEAAVTRLSEFDRAGTERTITTAMGNNSRARLTGGTATPAASRNSFYVSTQGLSFDPDLTGVPVPRGPFNLWVSADWRSYSDAVDGSSVDLLVGGDWLVPEGTLFGVMAGAGQSEIDDGVSESETDSQLIGAYMATELGGTLILDGYLALGTADYDIDGAAFDTDRYFAGLTLSGAYPMAAGTVTPRARLTGSWEEFPAYTGSSGPVAAGDAHTMRASVGARYDWAAPLGDTALRPFASLDLEYGDAESVAGVSSDYLSPRAGFGVAGQIGPGYLDAQVDLGQIAEDVADAGLRLRYELRF